MIRTCEKLYIPNYLHTHIHICIQIPAYMPIYIKHIHTYTYMYIYPCIQSHIHTPNTLVYILNLGSNLCLELITLF